MVADFSRFIAVSQTYRGFIAALSGEYWARRTGNTRDLFFARMRVLASVIEPSLAFGSPACMTESEALAKIPKATHFYMRQNCWSDSAIAPVHWPRPPRAAVRAPSARPTLAVAPKTVNSGTDAGMQCQYSPCE